MATYLVIVKNEAVADVIIEDLGKVIPGEDQVELSEEYTFTEIAESLSLDTLVLAGDLIINNGADLTPIEGSLYLKIANKKFTYDEFYSRIELQGSGDASIHWDNVTNKPTFGSPSWVEPVDIRVLAVGAATAPSVGLTEGAWYIDDAENIFQYVTGSWQDAGYDAYEGKRVIDLSDADQDIVVYNGTTWVNEDQAADNTGVLVDNDGDGKQAQYAYNTSSAVWSKIGDVDFSDHLNGAPAKHDSSEIVVENNYANSGITANDSVESAMGSINTAIGNNTTAAGNAQTTANGAVSAITAHENGTSSKHDATEIDDESTYTNILGAPTNVQATLDAIDTALGVVNTDTQNNLDGAYDEGGEGSGRTINTTHGPVKFDAGASPTSAPVEITPYATLPSGGSGALALADGQLAVKDGILCIYDDARSKWLSVQRQFLVFGRKGRTRNQYLDYFIGDLASNNSGLRMNRNATVVSMTAQLDKAADGSVNFNLRKNDATSTIATIEVTDTNIGEELQLVNLDLAQGDYLQSYLQNSNRAEDPVLIIELAWRP